ncbi:MAG: hypothetical protein ACKVPJ_04500 [Chitinophagales bacterium]
MKNETITLLTDILIILFLLLGALWQWGIMKLRPAAQKNLEKIFEKSRWRMKWLFLIGFVVVAGMFLWRRCMS